LGAGGRLGMSPVGSTLSAVVAENLLGLGWV
jgi:hypothetical protein